MVLARGRAAPSFRIARGAAVALVSCVLGLTASSAEAADPETECRVVDVDITPSDGLQLVAWLEDTAGNFVETIYLTHAIGTYGLGNRPGMMEFNSGPWWPYGRRETVFPVWAHRHGRAFPLLVFQNGDDRNLSHPFTQSSVEQHFCRPIAPEESLWDAETCASSVFTDKGVFSPDLTSAYPPRADLAPTDADSPSVAMFAELNPFDLVSQATPPGGAPYRLSWPIPTDLADGDYVMWVEAAKEFDGNATYNETTYPAPKNIPWASYGQPYRGQPSVIYRVPFTISREAATATTDSYAGYGDPDGLDGTLRPPDATIETEVPGSGASRLALTVGDAGAGMFRVRVIARPEVDHTEPAPVDEAEVVDLDHRSAQIRFVAPGDDATEGQVTGYQVRIRVGEPITEANFDDSMPTNATIDPDEAGQVQLFSIEGLLPLTTYSIGIRAYDNCRNYGELVAIELTTTDRMAGEVDACFVATAAYGSLMANEVEMLRHFRDAMLETTVLGELAVEAYYTFGPALAGVVGESDVLRAQARGALAPLVAWVRGLSVVEPPGQNAAQVPVPPDIAQ